MFMLQKILLVCPPRASTAGYALLIHGWDTGANVKMVTRNELRQ